MIFTRLSTIIFLIIIIPVTPYYKHIPNITPSTSLDTPLNAISSSSSSRHRRKLLQLPFVLNTAIVTSIFTPPSYADGIGRPLAYKVASTQPPTLEPVSNKVKRNDYYNQLTPVLKQAGKGKDVLVVGLNERGIEEGKCE
jgi:hypothetical protein